MTKHIFVVKTEITAKHPLGYIHFAFYPNRRDDKRFVCECKRARVRPISDKYLSQILSLISVVLNQALNVGPLDRELHYIFFPFRPQRF